MNTNKTDKEKLDYIYNLAEIQNSRIKIEVITFSLLILLILLFTIIYYFFN